MKEEEEEEEGQRRLKKKKDEVSVSREEDKAEVGSTTKAKVREQKIEIGRGFKVCVKSLFHYLYCSNKSTLQLQ